MLAPCALRSSAGRPPAVLPTCRPSCPTPCSRPRGTKSAASTTSTCQVERMGPGVGVWLGGVGGLTLPRATPVLPGGDGNRPSGAGPAWVRPHAHTNISQKHAKTITNRAGELQLRCVGRGLLAVRKTRGGGWLSSSWRCYAALPRCRAHPRQSPCLAATQRGGRVTRWRGCWRRRRRTCAWS